MSFFGTLLSQVLCDWVKSKRARKITESGAKVFKKGRVVGKKQRLKT